MKGRFICDTMYYMKRVVKKNPALKESAAKEKKSASVKVIEPFKSKLVKSKKSVEPKKSEKVTENNPVKKRTAPKIQNHAVEQVKPSKTKNKTVSAKEIKVNKPKTTAKSQTEANTKLLVKKTSKISQSKKLSDSSKVTEKKSVKKSKAEIPAKTGSARSKTNKNHGQTPDKLLQGIKTTTLKKPVKPSKEISLSETPKKTKSVKVEIESQKSSRRTNKPAVVSVAKSAKVKEKVDETKNIKSKKITEKANPKALKQAAAKPEKEIKAVLQTIEIKPVKKKIKPLGSAVVRGKTGRYDFEIFPLDAEIKDGSAIYLISKRITDKSGRGHHKFVCIGQTESLIGDLKKHKKDKCIKQHKANVVCLLREQDAKNRLKIETDLLEAHTVFCNQK